jgi:hypothetical protein
VSGPQKFIELRSALVIQNDDLSIENTLNPELA